MIRNTAPIIILSLLLLNSQLSYNQSALPKFLNSPALRTASASILVKNLQTGKVIATHHAGKALTTASTMKAVTTATALEVLGADFQFKTQLAIDGSIDTNGTLNGNLYIIGYGDPTLGSEKIGNSDFLTEWVLAIKNAGIKSINGRITGIESCFSDQVINPLWSWEDMGNYYASGVHPIAYKDNMYRLYFSSGNIGSTPEIIKIEPEIAGLNFTNFVKSTTTKTDNAYFYGAPYQLDRSIYGEIPANKSNFIVKGDMPHPALILLTDLKLLLKKSGINTGNIETSNKNPLNIRTIHTHLSPTLREIVKEINQESNNQFAEYLFKQISLYNNETGNYQSSKSITTDFWKKAGLDTAELFQFDGSGLSRQNAASANFMVSMLEYMHKKSKYTFDFKNSLAVSGSSGTFKNFLNTNSLRGKVHGKSGTIALVKSYTGYMETKKGTLVFAVLVNNANASSKDVTGLIEQFLIAIAD